MIGRALAWGTSVLVLAVILELGLRVMGFAPPVSVTEPDVELGWRNVPARTFHRSSREYDVDFSFDSLGLRDDEIGTRVAGEQRVLMLGDSFVLGYTLARPRHFVDLLEKWLNERSREGHSFQVINAGVEGYSTDQELLLLRRLHTEKALVDGARGDVVVLCMYMNDLYWLDQPSYMGTPKPLLAMLARDGGIVDLESAGALHARPRPWWERCSAIGHAFFARRREPPRVSIAGVGEIYAERGIFLREPPAYIRAATQRCEATLRTFRRYCEGAGLRYLVALIPHKVQVDQRAGGAAALGMGAAEQLDLERGTAVFTVACRRAGINGAALLDPLHPPAAEEAFDAGAPGPLYYRYDWHFSPLGSFRFARALAARLGRAPFFDDLEGVPGAGAAAPASPAGMLLWPWLLGALWVLLSLGYALSYRDEKPWWVACKIALLLAFVAGLIAAIGALVGLAPPRIARLLPLLVVALVALLVLLAARRKIGTIFELFGAFIERGHWYMVPLLTVLLAIGTLLIVAASNPFVAPFIYTLF